MTALVNTPKAVISAATDDYPKHRWVIMLLPALPNAPANSIYSDIEQRKLKFNSGAVFMVILPARTRWLGYTRHKTAAAALRKMQAYDRDDLYYEVIDCHGDHYERDINSDGELILTKIPNKKLNHIVKQEIVKDLDKQ